MKADGRAADRTLATPTQPGSALGGGPLRWDAQPAPLMASQATWLISSLTGIFFPYWALVQTPSYMSVWEVPTHLPYSQHLFVCAWLPTANDAPACCWPRSCTAGFRFRGALGNRKTRGIGSAQAAWSPPEPDTACPQPPSYVQSTSGSIQLLT